MSSFEIVAREDFSPVTYLLEVRHPLLAKAARPGQFVIVMPTEHGERIPLTIADFDRERGTITLVIQAVGKSTKEMQQSCKVGTSLYAMVGPMGIPSPLSHVKKALVVGGGLGVAPTFPQARALQSTPDALVDEGSQFSAATRRRVSCPLHRCAFRRHRNRVRGAHPLAHQPPEGC